MLVATLMMLVVTGAVFALVNPDTETSQAQPEAMDMQQRARVANDVIGKDLIMAGAGVYSGSETGKLLSFFAPIIPRVMGLNNADAWDTARADAVTITYIPQTYSQTTISNAMPQTSAEIKVVDQPNCPKGRELCGFTTGDEALIFDHDGHFDLFTITNVQDSAAHLQHRDNDFSFAYQPGAYVVLATTATYYLDSVNHQLRYYDGYLTDVPVVDNVVGLTFQYWGEPTPPIEPKPTDGTANCLYDSAGNYVAAMATLTTDGGSLAPMPISMLHDGPWCGSGSSRFDADLLRVRKVRVTVRVQASQAQFRGTDSNFAIAGTQGPAEKWLPDYTLSFDIAPRNMNLGR
jgi:hypothetical protein